MGKKSSLIADAKYFQKRSHPTNFYLFKVNNKNTRKKCGICSKLTIKTPERRLCGASKGFMKAFRRRSGVFIVNFEHILHLFLVFLLLTLHFVSWP